MNEDVTRPVRSGDGGPRAGSSRSSGSAGSAASAASAASASRNEYSMGSGSVSGARPMPTRASADPSAAESARPRDDDRDDRPVVAIMSELWSNTETLVRQEVELGLAELDRRTERVQDDLKQAAVGASVAFAGMLALVAAAVLLLANFVAPWVSALIVGLAASGGGYALLRLGAEDIEDAAGDAARAVLPSPDSRSTKPNEPRHLEGGHS